MVEPGGRSVIMQTMKAVDNILHLFLNPNLRINKVQTHVDIGGTADGGLEKSELSFQEWST